MKLITVTKEDITKRIRLGGDGLKDLTGDCPLARGLNYAFPNGGFIVGTSSYIEKNHKWLYRNLPSKA